MDQPEQLRDFSAAIFGNSYALEVMALIARWDRPSFYVRELTSELGLPSDNLAQPIVQRLLNAGLVKELPRRGRRGIRYFEVQEPENPVWELVTALYDQ